jgi:hypothetical protein
LKFLQKEGYRFIISDFMSDGYDQTLKLQLKNMILQVLESTIVESKSMPTRNTHALETRNRRVQNTMKIFMKTITEETF